MTRKVDRPARAGAAGKPAGEIDATLQVRILAADGHPVVLHGLKAILSGRPEMTIEATAADSESVMSSLAAGRFDLLVLAIDLPGTDGIDLIQEIRKRGHNLPVLIFSTYSEEIYAIRALQAGARGYLSKRAEADEVTRAVEAVADGEVYVSPAFAGHLAALLSHEERSRSHEVLSAREFHVLRMIAAGESTKAIAQGLKISLSTVSTYRSRILRKLNLTTTSQLIHFAFKNHLID